MRKNFVSPRVFITAASFLLIAFSARVHADLTAHDYSVEVAATISESPPRITLYWPPDGNATDYQVARKVLGDSSWTSLATLPATSITWTDTNVTLNIAYEYQVSKHTTTQQIGYGYVCSSIRRALVEQRGTIILLTESVLASQLSTELARLQLDLVGDGWTVVRRDISKTASVSSVKATIKSIYDQDPQNTKAVFLFGHIPVPHSGNIDPDMHPDHTGAWQADVYYGTLSGEWTDSTVDNSNIVTSVPNIPGDGKFDQDYPPGPVVLQVGRVDLSNLTCFANKASPRYEVDLARNYLNKDHLFRHGKLGVERRGVVYESQWRGLEPEPQACTAWRSFPGFFGTNQIKVLGPNEYLPLLATNSYLWSYVRSAGSMYQSVEVATSDEWALNEPKVVFTAFMGSYFGEWDHESAFMRAALGTSGYILTCVYAGQPQWILHPMGMGETIGYITALNQNNRTNSVYPSYSNAGFGQVHVSLLGDPTLRMHPVAPVGALTGVVDASGVHLNWTISADRSVVGYLVYKANSSGEYVRISGSTTLTTLSFTDAAGTAQDSYLVRASKLEQTPSGSYWNLSQGLFFPDPINGNGGQNTAPPAVPTQLSAMIIKEGGPSLHWGGSSASVRAFQIQRRLYPNGVFATLGEAPGTSASYTDTTAPQAQVAYRIKALGYNAESDFSPELVVNLRPPTATLVGVDQNTHGDWIGKYGAEGYLVITARTNFPSYVSFDIENFAVWGNWSLTNDLLTLQRPDSTNRVLAGWGTQTFGPQILRFRFNDGAIHRVTIYMIDYYAKALTGTIQVTDPYSNQALQSIPYANFESGQYITFDLQNYADIYLAPSGQYEGAQFSALFFDAATLDAPAITPGSGEFTGKTVVSMSSFPGAVIRFTTDGSEPTPTADVFTQPFTLTTNALIAAKAFKAGYPESQVSRAALTNDLITAASSMTVDPSTQGDWRPIYGTNGCLIPASKLIVPEYAEINVTNAIWTWEDPSSASRALNKYSRTGARIASCWYGASEVAFDLVLYTNKLQQVALYLMDWEGGRDEDVTISDAAGRIILRQRVQNFGSGVYVVFYGKGILRISAKSLAGANAVINGLFIGGSIPVSSAPAQLATSPLLGGGNYTLQIAGQPGQTFAIQSTSDFRTWHDIGMETLSGNQLTVSLPWTNTPGVVIFRATLVP